MKAEKLDFDEAFNTLKLSENLRVSYKKEIYGKQKCFQMVLKKKIDIIEHNRV